MAKTMTKAKLEALRGLSYAERLEAFAEDGSLFDELFDCVATTEESDGKSRRG